MKPEVKIYSHIVLFCILLIEKLLSKSRAFARTPTCLAQLVSPYPLFFTVIVLIGRPEVSGPDGSCSFSVTEALTLFPS